MALSEDLKNILRGWPQQRVIRGLCDVTSHDVTQPGRCCDIMPKAVLRYFVIYKPLRRPTTGLLACSRVERFIDPGSRFGWMIVRCSTERLQLLLLSSYQT